MAKKKQQEPKPEDGTLMRRSPTEVANWEAELAAGVEEQRAEEQAGGQFYSTKGGALTLGGVAVPGNQLVCVVLDSIHERVYYGTKKYDPQNPGSGPVCCAYSRDGKNERPHEVVVAAGSAQAETCATCKWDKFGTSDLGKGKACKQQRRLALLPCGAVTNGRFVPAKAAALREVSVGLLRVPVTSVKAFSSLVVQMVEVGKRPLWSVVTRVWLQADPKDQFHINFSALEELPREFRAVVMERRPEARAMLEAPPVVGGKEESSAAKGAAERR